MSAEGGNVSQFSGAPAFKGYLYQCRYALFESLCRLRRNEVFRVSIETLDDVVFESNATPPDVLQTKHHVNQAADLTDGSPDLWKTIRIWCEGLVSGSIPEGSTLFLVTTSAAAKNSAAYYLKSGDYRNTAKAIERLNATAESSDNKANASSYKAYRTLSLEGRERLLEAIFILDMQPDLSNLDTKLKEVVYGFASRKFVDPFLQRLEGWWYREAITHLLNGSSAPILSEEIDSETALLREQFKQDNLPIDDDIMNESVDASGYQDRPFVHQLRLIEIGNPRILHAIRNLFRAFEQRSRWIREELLLIGELERYERRLVEEWDILFQQMRDDLGDEATEEAKKTAAQTIYKWIETGVHPPIRPSVTEPVISRGSYQLLSDSQRVGWHIEFQTRLRTLLETRGAAP